MINDTEILKVISLYAGMGGLVINLVVFFICVLLSKIGLSLRVAKGISGILIFIAILASGSALGGVGTWVWLDSCG